VARRRCRNCPDEPTPEPLPPKTMSVVAEEGEKLWNQALFSCQSVVEMMAGYVMLGVPGDPVRGLQRLGARINQLASQIDQIDQIDQISQIEQINQQHEARDANSNPVE